MFSFLQDTSDDEISTLKQQLSDLQKKSQQQSQQQSVTSQLALPGSALFSLDAAGGGPLNGMIDEFTADSQSQAGRLTKLESESGGGALKSIATIAKSAADAYMVYATAGASAAITAEELAAAGASAESLGVGAMF